ILRLHLRPGEPRLDQGKLLLQLVAVGAITLLQPAGRAVDADPDWRDPMRLAGLPDGVPQPRPLLEWDVDFPTKLADVGDPGRQRSDRPDVDEAAGAEREALVRHIGIGDRLQQVS